MKKLLPVIVGTLIGLFPIPTFTQSLEIGGFFGVSGYMGDLQLVQIEVLELHKAFGIFGRYNFSNTLALKLSFNKGMISGSDSNYRTVEGRRERNLSFRSPIYEAGLQMEAAILNFGDIKHRMAQAYLFSGIGGFYFDPQANYEGKWYRLQPLGTEGQGMDGYAPKYKLVQFAIPFGCGFKFNASQITSLGFSLGFRYTFTDYLDDVSTKYPDILALAERDKMAARLSYRTPEVVDHYSENPKGRNRGAEANDWYFFGGAEIAFHLFKKTKRY